MQYRKLGNTDLKVAEIGMGTWQLANDPEMWVGSDLKESMRALEEYVKLGGNFIDTAWIYGWVDKRPDTHPSEELIGKFLKRSGKRNNVIVATKIAPKNFKWPAHSGIPVEEVFPNDWIEKSVNDSLRSLEVEHIDLMQFHVWQDYFVDNDEWKQKIEEITRSGKVRYWGISANDYQPGSVLRTLDTGLISSVQFIFNIFHQKPTENLIPYARKNNIGLIARVPLDEAGLTGNITMDTEFEKGDFRASYFKDERREQLIKRVDELRKLANKYEIKSLVEMALRYVISFDEVSSTIPGMRKVEHVNANTSFSDKGKLPDELLEKLKEHVWERNFYYPIAFDPALKDTEYLEK